MWAIQEVQIRRIDLDCIVVGIVTLMIGQNCVAGGDKFDFQGEQQMEE